MGTAALIKEVGKLRWRNSLFSLFLIFCSCSKYEKILKIQDVTKAQIHEVNVTCDPTSIILSIQGELNGNATVEIQSVIDTNEFYVFKLKEGLIDSTMRGDWYTDDIYFNYRPQGASEGHLIVKANICGFF